MITSFTTPKNLSVSFGGVPWEFPLHPLPLRPVSLLDLVELFFLLNGSFPMVKASVFLNCLSDKF